MIVLEAAIAAVKHLNDQLIAITRRRGGAHQATGGFTDPFNISLQRGRPSPRRVPHEQQLVLMLLDTKRLAFKRTCLDWTIQQIVEIGGAPSIPITWEGAVDLPGVSAIHSESMGSPPASIQFHHHCSEAEGGELRIDKGRPHRQVPGFHHIAEAQRPWIEIVHQPLMGRKTAQGDDICGSRQLQAVQMLDGITDGVRARSPKGELQDLAWGGACPPHRDANALFFWLN